MGLVLGFRDDVDRILASAHQTLQASTQTHQGDGTGSHSADEALWLDQRDFTDALRVLALAFGLAPPANRLPRSGERSTR